MPTQLSLSPSASFRSLGEEGIILMADSGQLYSTNECGSAFVEQLQQGKSYDEALEAILKEFDVERPVLESDLKELCDYLLSEGVLVSS